jgi:hypothetical protein
VLPSGSTRTGNTFQIFFTGYFTQSTDMLLQQLMAEMKYLRERVDTLPTGLFRVQLLGSRLPRRSWNLVPNLFLLRRKWKSLNKQHYLIPRSLSLLNNWRLAP